MADVVLFAGPSAQGVPRRLIQHRDIDLRPPIRRGDLDLLIQRQPPAVAVLCDGVFKSAPAVSHAELCRALDAGWQVWGVASIGAIRAHEMRTEGMRGYGWVYAQFSRHTDFTDDELCLLHLPEPPYEPLTEALVNLRYALEAHGPALGIGAAASASIVAELRPIWFGDRSLGRLRAALLGAGGVTPPMADRLLRWLVRNRIKTLDLRSLLTTRPWRPPDRPGNAR